MTMKKSLIALAVSGAVAAPMSAQAAEAYGFVNVTVENASVEGGGGFGAGGGTLIFNTTQDDSGFGLSDTAASRFGFTGSEDLGNGLTAGYTFEFDVSTSFGGTGGSTNEDAVVSSRLANVSLGGDFGTVKLGTMWGVIYEYAGWNHYRTDGHGGATHYYMTRGLEDDPYGLRIDNALSYTYGGGGYSSDPFTFTVQARSEGSNAADEESIDALILGAQGTFAGVTLNAVHYSENNTTGPEESLTTLGGRWSSGPFYIGGTYFMRDNDNAAGTEPTALNVLGGMDFGGGISGYVGVGTGDADTDDDSGDLTTAFLQLQKELSSRTKIYGEYETAETDGGAADDAETSVLAIGVKHSF